MPVLTNKIPWLSCLGAKVVGEKMSNTFGLAGVMRAVVLWAGIMSPFASITAEPLIDTSKLINQVSNRVFEVAVSAARTQAEIEYDSITFNETLGTVSINDLVIEPLPHQGMSGCSLSIGHIAFSSSTPGHVSKDTVEFGLDDLRLAPTCLPFEARGMLAMAGVSTMVVPNAKVEISYNYPSGTGVLSAHGELADALGFSLHLKFPYFSIIDAYTPLHARLSEAELSVFNKGIWEDVSIQLPPQVTEPGYAGDFVAEIVGDGMFYGQPDAEAQKFLRQISVAWEDFLQAPTQITIRSNITNADGILLAPELLEDPVELINYLSPKLYAGETTQSVRMPAQDIKSIIYGNFSNYSDEMLLHIGEGFLSGKGYPRNEAIALKILNYLALQGTSGISHKLARHYLEQQNYALAYEFALKDSASGSTQSVNILNVAEPFLDLSDVLTMQGDGMIDFAKAVTDVEPAEYYHYAVASMNGKGMRKSYLAAYFWAILAQANGDRRTASMMTKIEALGADKNLANTLDWNAQLAQAQADALMVWMDRH